jgi:hypothetical protein
MHWELILLSGQVRTMTKVDAHVLLARPQMFHYVNITNHSKESRSFCKGTSLLTSSNPATLESFKSGAPSGLERRREDTDLFISETTVALEPSRRRKTAAIARDIDVNAPAFV